jgi:ADP-heptose:LPS heptosyltransferase
MRAIGFNAGQRGDLIMNVTACRAFKEQFPAGLLTFGIGKPYADMAPLFRHHPLIDDIHIWDSYNEWPNETDKAYLREQRFDIVFNAMPQHSRADWFAHHYQPEEVCYMHNLRPPRDLTCSLVRWFELLPEYKNCVSIALFAGNNSPVKALRIDRQAAIIEFLSRRGIHVVQLGDPTEPTVPGAYRIDSQYMQSVQVMLSTRFTIVGDTGLSWVAGAYKHHVLGLYGYSYYGYPSTQNYQPRNPNALYLEERHCNEIPLTQIFWNIDKLLDCPADSVPNA